MFTKGFIYHYLAVNKLISDKTQNILCSIVKYSDFINISLHVQCVKTTDGS